MKIAVILEKNDSGPDRIELLEPMEIRGETRIIGRCRNLDLNEAITAEDWVFVDGRSDVAGTVRKSVDKLVEHYGLEKRTHEATDSGDGGDISGADETDRH